MLDNKRPETIKEKTSVVGDWIHKMSETGKIGEMDPMLLREVLKAHGADFEISENDRRSLREYTNKGKNSAMHAIWGEKFNQYKIWVREWIPTYEQEILHGRELPKLGNAPKKGEADVRHKDSGMIQFFGEITAFAAGILTEEEFTRYVENRIYNGNVWNKYPNIEDRKKHQVKIVVPTSKEDAIKISSIPPEFPIAAWEYLIK